MTYCLSCFGESCELYNRKISLRKSVCRGESRIPQREGCQSDLLYMWRTPPSPPNLPMICCGQFYIMAINRVLTLPDTDTDNNADTDKMGLQPNCICVSVGVSVGVGQCEPLHTILYNPFLPAATKLGQGNIFRSVCQEFCPLGGRVSASVHAGIHPPPWEQTPPGADPPGKQTAAYGQRAGGTHPTGMHSCFIAVCVGQCEHIMK